jgi:hypothetical protein
MCVGNTCKVYFPGCPPPPVPQCKVDTDCLQPGAPCKLCPDGSSACPKTWCNNGVCAYAFPGCPTPPPTCACGPNEACVQQIGGPAVMNPPSLMCVALTPGCLGGPGVCTCIPNQGKCGPSPTQSGMCVCDNGIR